MTLFFFKRWPTPLLSCFDTSRERYDFRNVEGDVVGGKAKVLRAKHVVVNFRAS